MQRLSAARPGPGCVQGGKFEADMPNERRQSGFTHYTLPSGTDTEILTWLDDHSRYAMS